MLNEKKIKQIQDKMDEEIEYYRKRLNNLFNILPNASKGVHYMYIEDYAHVLLAANKINEAKEIYKKAADLFYANGNVSQEMLDKFNKKYEMPFVMYLGHGKHQLDIFVNALLPYIRASIATAKGKSGSYQYFRCLLLNSLIDHQEEMKNNIEKISKYYDPNDFDASGLPKSKNYSSLRYGYAIFGMNLVNAILKNDTNLFESNIERWTKHGLGWLREDDGIRGLVDLELVVLYDIALGVGMHPKINSILIPKSIVENGYWNKP